MVSEERIKCVVEVFTFLMKGMVSAGFRFPGGEVSRKGVAGGLELLAEGGEVSRERIIDFCVCQVYAISGFDRGYLRRWRVAHSFGEKAVERFRRTGSGKRYYEDRWLQSRGLSRKGLVERFRSRREHPLAKLIFPEYEEVTKQRMYNSEVGFYLCMIGTLGWTPFSPSCRGCKHEGRCMEATGDMQPELYRIRLEAYRENTK